MTCKPGDALHLADGTHRSTARTANGREVGAFDDKLARHLAKMDQAAQREEDRRADQDHRGQ